MKVIFDHQIFKLQKFGGIPRYHVELWKNLRKLNIDAEIPIPFSLNEYILDEQLNSFPPFFRNIDFKGKHKLLTPLYSLNRKKMKNILKSDRLDLFHPTYYDNYFISELNKPFVITIHDMIYEKFPGEFHNQEMVIRQKKQLLKKADAVLAVSENTKKDILEHYPFVKEDKVSVTHLASSHKPVNKIDTDAGNYILYVGSRRGYKNFMPFLFAVKDFLFKNNFRLICAGGTAFSREEAALFEELGIADRIEALKANDRELKALYRKAFCLVIPSRYEGFGIPMVEAFSQACPVVANKKGSLPEIGEGAALFYEDETSLMEQLNVLLNDDNRMEKKKQSLDKSRDYSWEKTARKTLEVYKKVTGNE